MTQSRKKPAEARAAILAVAHRHFVEGGPDAVKVQRIAQELGITDAAIHYHFKNRETLMAALLSHAGAELKASLTAGQASDTPALIKQLSKVYADQGYARLAMWLSMHGWENEGQGMFAELVEQWCAENPDQSRQDVQFQIALINLISAALPLMGGSFLRSVGVTDNPRNNRRFQKWVVDLLQQEAE